jgi:hypothetical protein
MKNSGGGGTSGENDTRTRATDAAAIMRDFKMCPVRSLTVRKSSSAASWLFLESLYVREKEEELCMTSDVTLPVVFNTSMVHANAVPALEVI